MDTPGSPDRPSSPGERPLSPSSRSLSPTARPLSPSKGLVTTGAVVALKPTELAKSRLSGLPDPLRRRVAWTMAVDTLTALSAVAQRVLVVSDQPSLQSRLARLGLTVSVVPEPRPATGPLGMNGALAHGARLLADDGCGLVLACVGDLPALRPGSVRAVLQAAGAHRRSFLADASGIGTTMLAAHGADLDPRFQGRSAAAHRVSGAVALGPEDLGGPLADARRDVDTEVDLADAAHLGLGPATAALLDPATLELGRHAVVTATAQQDATGDQLALTADGYRVALPAGALQDGLRQARLGQRLHAVVLGGRVLAAWL